MQKWKCKQSRQWLYWELASKAGLENEEALFACKDCNASVKAKDAMKSGWVKVIWMGTQEPIQVPEEPTEICHICPACQTNIGIDIEDGYALDKPGSRSPSRSRSSRRSRSRPASKRSSSSEQSEE